MCERGCGHTQVRIPAAALLLLQLRFRGELGEGLIGDLQEELLKRERRGVHTRLWLWRQTLTSVLTVPPDVTRGWRPREVREGARPGSPASFGHFFMSVRRAFRTLRRRRLLAAVTSLTLALGIGASTIALTVVNGVLLRPLPYDSPGELVGLNRLTPEVTGPKPTLAMLADIWMVPYSLFLDWHEHGDAFAAIGAYAGSRLTVTDEGEVTSLTGLRSTSGVFSVLGVSPALGRVILPADDKLGAPLVAVLSHGLWETRYGADPDVIGRTIRLSGTPYTVIGVMPRGFVFPMESIKVWHSLADDHKQEPYRAAGYLKVIARLRSGVSLGAAQERMDAVARALGARHPEEKLHGIRITAYERLVVGDANEGLVIFLGGVAMLLLITCANTAGLLLVRLAERGPELGVRTALGAGRWHLLVETVSEGMVLSLGGGLLGTCVAVAGLRPFVDAFPGRLPRAHEIGVDWLVPVIGLGLSVLIGLAIGCVPALRLLRGPVGSVVHGGRRAATDGVSQSRLQGVLVVAQVSLAFSLVAGAGLFVQSYRELARTHPGFESRDLSYMDVMLPERYRGKPVACYRFFTGLAERLRVLPGVTGVASVEQLPFVSGLSLPPVFVDSGRGVEKAAIHVSNVSPSYFQVMGIPIVAGRPFDATDRYDTSPVTVINRAMAERFWPGQDPVGRRIDVGSEGEPYWLTVVGVVGNVRYRATQAPLPELYRSIEQSAQWYLSVIVQSRLDREVLARQAVAAVHALDPDIPVAMGSLAERIAQSPGFAGPRFGAFAISALAAVAALLAVLGIYGVLAFMVVRRTQEIGIRVALGARPGALLRGVLARGAALVVPGLLIGLTVALLGGRVLDSVLFGVRSSDPASLLLAALLVTGSGLAASLLPACRAASMDAVESLRRE